MGGFMAHPESVLISIFWISLIGIFSFAVMRYISKYHRDLEIIKNERIRKALQPFITGRIAIPYVVFSSALNSVLFWSWLLFFYADVTLEACIGIFVSAVLLAGIHYGSRRSTKIFNFFSGENHPLPTVLKTTENKKIKLASFFWSILVGITYGYICVWSQSLWWVFLASLWPIVLLFTLVLLAFFGTIISLSLS
jgi:hypothetical protein